MLSCIRLENDDRNNSCYRPHHSQCWPYSNHHLSLQNKDQIFQFVKIQTQAEEQILSTQKCEIFWTLTANFLIEIGIKFLVKIPLRQQQFQSSSISGEWAIINTKDLHQKLRGFFTLRTRCPTHHRGLVRFRISDRKLVNHTTEMILWSMILNPVSNKTGPNEPIHVFLIGKVPIHPQK